MLFILDGHALAYRHYFAQSRNQLSTSSGEPTGAIYGFARTLLDILIQDKPNYLLVAFDEGMSGRDTLYPAYKGTREKMPDDLSLQMRRIRQLVEAFNIPILAQDGYEADDLMGTIARQAAAQGIDVRIITGDRDLLQLLDERVTVRLAVPVAGRDDEQYDVEHFREKWGFEPRQLIDYKALVGDSSDNIPGVSGIGDKGATNLIQQFGSLDAIYANIDQIAGSVHKKLEAGHDMAYLSYQLATIHTDLNVTFDPQACVAHDFDGRKVRALFDELQFRTLLKQLNTLKPLEDGETPIEVADSDELPAAHEAIRTVIVDDESSLRELVDTLNAAQAIAFDTETTGIDQMTAQLVGMSFSVDGKTGYYVPVGHHAGQAAPGMLFAMEEPAPDEKQLPLETVIEALRPALTNPNIPKIAHNANYDMVVLSRYGIDVTPMKFDTMIAEWLRGDTNSNLGLKKLSAYLLGLQMTEIKELLGKGKNQITMEQVAIEKAGPYAAADAACTYRLSTILQDKLDEIDDGGRTLRIFNEMEMPLVPVLTDMERTGVLIDTDELARQSVALSKDMTRLEGEIYENSGGYGNFNINSPKQLNDVLFGKLGIKSEGLRRTTHGVTTDAATLEELANQYPQFPILGLILEYRELSKLKSTYVDALPALVLPETGRVHTDFNQTGASSGRLSSSNPNLQNIPIRTESGRKVRGAFVAPEGYVLLSVDYSQVELRIAAHIAADRYGDDALLEAFAQGQDIHAATASIVYGIPLDQVTKTHRTFAKRVNFGILYGMGAFRLTRESDMTLAEARQFIDTYFARIPGVQKYIEDTKQMLHEQGYVETLFGRRRIFHNVSSLNRTQQGQLEREAINMPIQGTAADVIKLAMIDLHHELATRRTGARLLLQVHDELVLEAPEAQKQDIAQLVVDVMEHAYTRFGVTLRVPLKANAQWGYNWLDLKAI
ncbi:MAG: DNA polymerase I [Anaerolineae bacterium]|nr:DNA polymerase I [Anaerolineae bacterium]